jgi:hypothetical protein
LQGGSRMNTSRTVVPSCVRSSRAPFGVVLALTLAAGTSLSCGLYSLDSLPAEDDVEQVVLHIAVVPSDVRCIRVTATGPGRAVERELETAGETSLTQSLTGLPLGSVSFVGEAFSAACASVSKSTIAAWTSQPVVASIVLGRLANVDLVMVRNGRAKVDISFTEEGACTKMGAACRLASECCSRKCSAGACVAPEDPEGTETKIVP